ncbi:Gfo/Idh/MocA family protein [Thermocrispum municipale]|uniref:Gfo/Idh/MocA family protein n=1 Tax=Thermocrispum municipale TaxID=37926 RepID=UPI00048AB91B|nr:Gfo/Idh/MocA family oxidoreductase [Thermocrispum municipale]
MDIGVAGVGRIGQMHAAHLTELDGDAAPDKILLFDPVPGRAEAVAAALPSHVTAVASFDDLLAADGVLVATPTDTHSDLVRRAVRGRTPVLCEKPLAGDLESMTTLVDDIESSGVDVVVGFQRRFDPATVEAYRRVRSGEAGQVYLVRSSVLDHVPPPKEYIPTSGGLFKDCMIHDLDAVPWLVGEEVVEVSASGSVLVDQAFADAGDVDYAVVTLRFASGAHAQMTAGRHDPIGYDCKLEVYGSKQVLAVGWNERTPVVRLEPQQVEPTRPWESFMDRYKDAYLNELRVFADVIEGKVANPSPARESLYSLRLAEACDESLRTGKPVRLEAG